MLENLLKENNISKQDLNYFCNVIKVLQANYDRLDSSRQLTTINLLLRLAFTQDTQELVIPPMKDLYDLPQVKRKNLKRK